MSKSRLALVITLSVLVLVAAGFWTYNKYGGTLGIDASADTVGGSDLNTNVIRVSSPGDPLGAERDKYSTNEVFAGMDQVYNITLYHEDLWKAILGKDSPSQDEIKAWMAANPYDRFYIKGWLADGINEATGRWIDGGKSNFNMQIQYPLASGVNLNEDKYEFTAKVPENVKFKDDNIVNVVRILRYKCKVSNCAATQDNLVRIAQYTANKKITYASNIVDTSIDAADESAGEVYNSSGFIDNVNIIARGVGGKIADDVKFKVYVPDSVFLVSAQLIDYNITNSFKKLSIGEMPTREEVSGQTFKVYEVSLGGYFSGDRYNTDSTVQLGFKTKANTTATIQKYVVNYSISTTSIEPNISNNDAWRVFKIRPDSAI